MNFTSHTIQANGITLHYYRSGGDKPPLVLLHGFTDDGSCWFPVTDSLAQDYDLIVPDVRGHGKSARIGSSGFSSELLAADAAALIEALNLRQPAVLGHSLGGYTALLLAAWYPERVGCLLMEDPPFSPPPTPESEAEREQRMRDWANNLREQQAQSLEELRASGHSRSPQWSAAELEVWAEAKHRVDPAVFDEKLIFPPWKPLLQQVQCPALLLYGDSGTIVDEAAAQEAAALWKQGRAVQIAHAGHSIRRDNAADYLAAVHAFLREHYSASR